MSDCPPALAPLFAPFDLAGLHLPNRFVMAPMTRRFAPDGVPGADVVGYYRRRSEAGVSLIVTEGIGVDHPAALGSGGLHETGISHIHGDAAIAGRRAVVDAVHGAGGRIIPQLWHMGPIRAPGTGPVPSAPSMRPSGHWGPREKSTLPPAYLDAVEAPIAPMREADIADVIAGYARSAANARAVGFDGIALHGAHGYLLDSFLWDATNHRTDRWGGEPAQRAQFVAAVIAAIRAEIGPGMPIIYRWSQWKLDDYDAMLATSPRELEASLRPLLDAGVDCFDSSTRVWHRPAFAGSPVSLAGWVKKLTGAASMAVGSVGLSKDLQSGYSDAPVAVDNLADVAARIAADEFDLIGVGRSLLVDPDWVGKARRGEPFAPFSQAAYATLT
ncbi:12-oxophytodienoate reductase [Novosphingobium sp. BL-52-GroH]|uniref:oxidoreductase n=1 Tax=Novosphingobium sp. BL-52-GroH TaxID=3349877 RepID=UPI00384ABB59